MWLVLRQWCAVVWVRVGWEYRGNDDEIHILLRGLCVQESPGEEGFDKNK